MNTSSANKRRRSSSPSSSTATLPTHPNVSSPTTGSTSRSAAGGRPPTASPSRTMLPAPIPSSTRPPSSGPAFPAFAGPSIWATAASTGWTSIARSSRRSMDARSPTPGSPRMEGIEEGSESGVVFQRDTTGRAPRSMMACTRCRRQKMKCDGPSNAPCRGCRQSGSKCVFENRQRPKSISTLPTRAPPFHSGTLPLSGPGGPGPSSGRAGTPSSQTGGFYPSVSQPAPPVTSRPQPPLEFSLRQAREPMPPPPATSISVLTSPYPHQPPPRGHSPPILPPPSAGGIPPPHPAIAQAYNPPPLTIPGYTPSSGPSSAPLSTMTQDSRIRSLETTIQSLAGVPAMLARLEASLSVMQRNQDILLSTSNRRPSLAPSRPRQIQVDVPEPVWESYRTRAWPLTPWLVGLREATGLPSLIVSLLGKRTMVDRGEVGRRECEEAMGVVMGEIGRLVAQQGDWTREEVRALGVFATWVNDTSLSTLTVGIARRLGHDRLSSRRQHDDWREWIYISIMDHLTQLPDFGSPISPGSLATAWRDRLSATAPGDPAVRDRDLKLLSWLEYAEMLNEVFETQRFAKYSASPTVEVEEDVRSVVSDRGDRDRERERERAAPLSATAAFGPGEEAALSERRKVMDVWRKFSPRWEAWAGGWAARSDPIVSLHFNYAVLFTATPIFLGSTTIWADLSQSHDGYTQLERARDAAFALIQAICSPEIGRTLVYSFALYRPLLGLALATIITLSTALPTSPLISLTHVLATLRTTYDTVTSLRPLDQPQQSQPLPGGGLGNSSLGLVVQPPPPQARQSLLAEIVESGSGGGALVGVGKREVWGVEPGPELWRRILG